MASEASIKLSECEPNDWFVVFHPETPKWWVRWLAWGRFKHVSVFGEVPRADSWVFFDYQLDRARIFVIANAEADMLIGKYATGTTIVRMARRFMPDFNVALSIGGWCVPAVAHILGLRSCALRPDALFRQCLANGGQIVSAGNSRDANKTQGRSGAEAPATGGATGEDQHDSDAPLVGD